MKKLDAKITTNAFCSFAPRLVCFDLDGTVMLRPNSLQYLCALNHAPVDALLDIDRRQISGKVDWIGADYERAALISGLRLSAVEENFDAHLETIGNLSHVLRTLESHDIVTVLISSGPVEVAQALSRRFSFDHCFGSLFTSEAGVYTGRITRHLGSRGKMDCLMNVCEAERLTLPDCAAVGDGLSDVDLFVHAGIAIGMNCSAEVTRFVQHEINGGDLSPILPLVLGRDLNEMAGII